MKKQKYYPLGQTVRSYDPTGTIKDGFGSEWPEFVLDDNGLVWQQQVVRPGEANAEVVGYVSDWMRESYNANT